MPSGLAFRLLRNEEHVDPHGEELDQFTNKEGCMQKYKSRIINIEVDKDPCMQRNLK